MITRRVSLLCVVLLGGGLLAGCSAGDSSDSGTNQAASAADMGEAVNDRAAAGGNAAAEPEAVKPADVAKAAAAPAAATRLVRTAEITVEVKDVGAAARS